MKVVWIRVGFCLDEHGRVRTEVTCVDVTENLVTLLHNISHEDRYARTIARKKDLQAN